MKVINFTTNQIKGTTQHPLVFDSSIASNMLKGISTNIVASTVFRQIEAFTNTESLIILELPLWLTVEVEMMLAQNRLVKEVFYFLDGMLIPSPLFSKYNALITEKSILQSICNEQQEVSAS